VAVDYIQGEQQRDAMRRLFDRDLLQRKQAFEAKARRQSANLAAADAAFDASRCGPGTGRIHADARMVELADLFGLAHAAQQVVDEVGHRLSGLSAHNECTKWRRVHRSCSAEAAPAAKRDNPRRMAACDSANLDDILIGGYGALKPLIRAPPTFKLSWCCRCTSCLDIDWAFC
jgi:hypothetical protein